MVEPPEWPDEALGDVIPIARGKPNGAGALLPVPNLRPTRSVPEPLRWPEIARALPPVPWLCKDLRMAPGRPVLLSAAAGAGKTWIAVSLALAVASSGHHTRALDSVEVQRFGRVVHLNFDYPAAAARRRYQRLAWGLDFTPREVLPWIDLYNRAELAGWSLCSADARDRLLRITTGATLCIVDALRGAVPNADLDKSEIRQYFDLLLEVSDLTGCTFLVIHHERKAGQTGVDAAARQDKAAGSHQIAAGCDVTLHVAKEGTAWRLTSGKVSEGQSDDEGLLVELVDVDGEYAGEDGVAPGVKFLAVSAEEAASKLVRATAKGAQGRAKAAIAADAETVEQVYRLIRDNPGKLSGKAIGKALAMAKAEALATMAELAEAGRVRNLGGKTNPRWVTVQVEE